MNRPLRRYRTTTKTQFEQMMERGMYTMFKDVGTNSIRTDNLEGASDASWVCTLVSNMSILVNLQQV